MATAQLAFRFQEDSSSPWAISDELRRFSYNGAPTHVEDRYGVPFFFNEFWTAQQRQAHSLHEVSYRACFKPQLPEFFITRLTAPGDTVYDPFMGRGTAPIQAALMGRRAIGNDINPLSAMLARPRTAPPTADAVHNRLLAMPWRGRLARDDLLTFYHRDTLSEICALRTWLIERDRMGALDQLDDWVRMVAINRLTGHSPGFLSVYSLPPNQAVSVEAQRRINTKRQQTPPRRITPEIIRKKSAALLKDGRPPAVETLFLTSPADRTPSLPTFSVDLVVTSPPFLDIVQYAADNWLRCWFAGIEASNVEITMHRKPEAWAAFVRDTFKELARVVRPGGHVAFEVGEVRNGTIELERLVLETIEGLPFVPLGVLVNVQAFTKTANCWGVQNNSKGTNTNRVVIVRRS